MSTSVEEGLRRDQSSASYELEVRKFVDNPTKDLTCLPVAETLENGKIVYYHNIGYGLIYTCITILLETGKLRNQEVIKYLHRI